LTERGHAWLARIIYTFGQANPFVIFILSGCIISLYIRNKASIFQMIIGTNLLFLMYCISHISSPKGKYLLFMIEDNLKALIFMIILSITLKATYNKNKYIAPIRLRRFITQMSEISYPLYLIHGEAFGFSLLILLVPLTANLQITMAIGLVIVIIFSLITTILIEKPCIAVGRRLAGWTDSYVARLKSRLNWL
jgi:peptidoglycan/LPS O-acetylase OafA/YrhL